MGGAPLLLAFAVVTVDYGWESDGRDGYRYIVQIPAEQLEAIERTGHITSQLPPELRGRVTSVVVRVGDGQVPRPSLPPVTKAADGGPARIAAVGSEQSLLPGPEETVRGQGESNAFTYPGDEIEPQSDAPAASAEDDAAATPPANSFGTSSFAGFGPQHPSSIPPSSKRQDAPSTSRTQSAPSTSRAEADASNASDSSAGDSASSGFDAVDSPREDRSRGNRWSSSPDPARNSTSRSTDPDGSADTPPSLRSNPATANTEQPWAERNADTMGNASGADRPEWPATAEPLPGAASDFELTAEARQRLVDQRLLEQVGIDEQGYAFDRHTGARLQRDDPRNPLIEDYVSRTGRAAVVSTPGAARLSTPPGAAGNVRADSYAPRSTAFGSQWDPPQPQQFQPVANNQSPAGDLRFGQNASGAAMEVGRDSTQTNGDGRDSRRGATSGDEDRSASDTDAVASTSDSRHRSLAAQPLFNFLLLLSIVGNVYLGIAISRLIRRYRNLVSTHRGTAA